MTHLSSHALCKQEIHVTLVSSWKLSLLSVELLLLLLLNVFFNTPCVSWMPNNVNNESWAPLQTTIYLVAQL